MDTTDPIEWKISLRVDDRAYVTDRCILLDQRVAFVDPLPHNNGTARQYEMVREYLAFPPIHSFGFTDLSVLDSGSFSGPEGLVLNRKYISFLIRRIPSELLRFSMTGNRKAPVCIFRGEEKVGLLMPIVVPLRFGPELLAEAESGDAQAQLQLGTFHRLGVCGAPKDIAASLKWYSRAAAQNYPRALSLLGSIFCNGTVVDKDLEKGLLLFEKAIEVGDMDAIRLRASVIKDIPSKEYRRISTRIACQMAVQTSGF